MGSLEEWAKLGLKLGFPPTTSDKGRRLREFYERQRLEDFEPRWVEEVRTSRGFGRHGGARRHYWQRA